MKKRIFLSIIAVALTVLILAFGISYFVMLNQLGKIQDAQLAKQAEVLSAQLNNNNGDYKYLDGINFRGTRVTLIGKDGQVLYDNREDVKNLRNHGTRKEVREAMETGYGKSTRFSKTMTEKYVYSAKRLDDNKIIRVSTSYSTLLGLIEDMAAPIIIMIILIVLLALWASYRLARGILKPINNVNLEDPSSIASFLKDRGYDELAPMFRKIDSQKRDLAQKNRQLDRRKAEFESITSSMKDGLVILDDKESVLVINRAALLALNLSLDGNYSGKKLVELLRDEEILASIRNAKEEGSSRKLIKLLDKTYQLDVSSSTNFEGELDKGDKEKVLHENKKYSHGTILFLFDITDKIEAETVRREFTANVSHELKTPLQSIYGSAELLKTGMVPPEDWPQFANRIYKESERMIRLVQDIIDLSKLDEEGIDHNQKLETINACEITKSAVEALYDKAAREGITLNFDTSKCQGSDGNILGTGLLVFEIAYNLIDNGIKYNREGGYVNIDLEIESEKVALIVKDNGVGIDEEDQKRVFERFFRVDKSHSRDIGGTGLGLSIVKHAAKNLGAEVFLESRLGVGTKVKVIFNK